MNGMAASKPGGLEAVNTVGGRSANASSTISNDLFMTCLIDMILNGKPVFIIPFLHLFTFVTSFLFSKIALKAREYV